MIHRIVLPLAGAILTAGLIGAAAFWVVSGLPQPTRGDRTGVRLLDVLETKRGEGSVISIAGRSLVARCEQLTARHNLVWLSDGSALVLAGSHVQESMPPTVTARGTASRELASTRAASPLLRAAEADLAGSYAVYATELTIQLERGSRVIRKETFHQGRPAYEVELGRELPRAGLIVDRETLQPLAATFESSSLDGRALLSPPVQLKETTAC